MKNSRQTYFHIYIKTDEMMIIYFDEPNEVADELFEWYAEKGVTDFGEEVDVYNENKEYIGEEPAGRYELQQLAASFAERLHREGTIKEHFGKDIPIIVHGLKYTRSDLEPPKKPIPTDRQQHFLTQWDNTTIKINRFAHRLCAQVCGSRVFLFFAIKRQTRLFIKNRGYLLLIS